MDSVAKSELGKRGDEPAPADESDPKKPKIDEEELEKSDSDDDDEEDEEDGVSIPVGEITYSYKSLDENPERREAFFRYRDQYVISQGFDLVRYDGPGFILCSIRAVDLEKDDFISQGCWKAVHFAIDKENQKRKAENKNELELVKILKSNVNMGGCYYATFEAKSKDEDIRVYQARVHYNFVGVGLPVEPPPRVFIFRLKPDHHNTDAVANPAT